MGPLLATAGRILGMIAGGVSAMLWMYVIWVPIGDFMLEGATGVAYGFVMALLGIVAAIAAFHGHYTVLFFCFVVSFFGVGAFSLNVDHWFRIFGILDLILLAASAMIWFSARGRRRKT
jgi:hypothetical protein